MKELAQFANSRAGQVVILAAVAAGVVYYGQKKAKKVAQAVNPVSDQNIFYQGTNAVGAAVTGEENFNLGYWIYDLVHGDD